MSIWPVFTHDNEGLPRILPAVTSNPGSSDLQRRESEGRRVFELVGEFPVRAEGEKRETDVGLVVGLTNAAGEVLAGLPDVPLLVPGLGAQGGDLSALSGSQRQAPNVINVSRGVLYGEDGTPGEQAARYAGQIAGALKVEC